MSGSIWCSIFGHWFVRDWSWGGPVVRVCQRCGKKVVA